MANLELNSAIKFRLNTLTLLLNLKKKLRSSFPRLKKIENLAADKNSSELEHDPLKQ